jgi:spermidine/putrescine transport system substrate-binding protein
MQSWLTVFCGLLLMLLVNGCETLETQKKIPPALAKELVFYNWVDDMPSSVLDAFTKEFGVKVNYITFRWPCGSRKWNSSGSHFCQLATN